MSISFLVLILALIFAALACVPWGNPSRPWTPYFWPLSWFCFMLAAVLTHGGINWRG
jgi:hypothetical protein